MDEAAARRRPPTPDEARTLGHPLRMRILRLAAQDDVTNQQLASALDVSPGTSLYHVRTLLKAGLLEAGDVRTGNSGALEKPYRATGVTWWLDDPLKDAGDDLRMAPLRLFWQELLTGQARDVATFATFLLHLTPADVVELDHQLLDVMDQWVMSDADRRSNPEVTPHRGAFAVIRTSVPPPVDPNPPSDALR